MDIPVAVAFTAGLIATLNPCGFAMLPAYLSFFLGLDDDATTSTTRRALTVGSVVSAGFLTVFGLAGILITIGVRAVVDALPWIAMIVGAGVIVLGAALLSGRKINVRLPTPGSAPNGRGHGGVYAFGVSYAIASLSCTLPVFLVVVAGTIPQLGFVAGVTTFLVYGLGMSTLLLVVTLAVAFGKRALIGRLRRASGHVDRVAGVILVLAGSYIVFFWATTLAGDGTSQPTVVRIVEQLSSRATNAVAGSAGTIGIAAGVVIAAAVAATVVTARRRRTARPDPADDPPTHGEPTHAGPQDDGRQHDGPQDVGSDAARSSGRTGGTP